MVSTQSLIIKLDDKERDVLLNALDVIEDIVCHLELNRGLGLSETRYGLEVNSMAFWKIVDYCVAIKADEEALKQANGEYGEKVRKEK